METIIIKQEEPKTYKTTQLALCPYLELRGVDNGVQFLKTNVVKDRLGRLKVEFLFLDPKDVCRDLEMEFRFSNEYKYRSLMFFYKKAISEALGLI